MISFQEFLIEYDLNGSQTDQQNTWRDNSIRGQGERYGVSSSQDADKIARGLNLIKGTYKPTAEMAELDRFVRSKTRTFLNMLASSTNTSMNDINMIISIVADELNGHIKNSSSSRIKSSINKNLVNNDV